MTAIGNGKISELELDHDPVKIICPACQVPIETEVSYKISSRTHMQGFVVLLFAFCCGFCVLPYCLNAFKDAYHKCPKCNALIGCHEGAEL
ncbi:CLUMA_CG004284, isoform A [Clunio marinus]|uniref:CLUMA_CG004284, isoform A n=1 Tax=Clunio marinus TaxID=568069 RepID=A0A1J1HVQ1_9DIPT|nr:CLUMA_CG004284, isoform A [Clunio marinus]